MNAQRLSHADLQPTFQGSAGFSSCCEATPGLVGNSEADVERWETGSWERGGSGWGMFSLGLFGGLLLGGTVMAFRKPLMHAFMCGTESLLDRFGFERRRVEGPHAPFDPRTRELNVGVGALSPQSYRSTEEVQETGEVGEASEESFPASDAPAWTGVSVGRCNGEPAT